MDGEDAVRDVSIPASIRWLVARAVDRESVGMTAGSTRVTPATRRKVAQFVEGLGDDETEFVSALASLIATWDWNRVVARVERRSDPTKVKVVRAFDLKHAAVAAALANALRADPTAPGNADSRGWLRVFEVADWQLTRRQRETVLAVRYDRLQGDPTELQFARAFINGFLPENKRRKDDFLGTASRVVRSVLAATEYEPVRRDALDRLRAELAAVRRLRWFGEGVELRAFEPEREVRYVLEDVLRVTVPEGVRLRRRLR